MTDLRLASDAFIRAIGVDQGASHTIFLGAGASISSGAPSAELCTWEWKRKIFLSNNPGLERQFSELTLRSVKDRIQDWLDKQGTFPAFGLEEEYSFYIEKCFPLAQHRRQFFADKIKGLKPHVGYKLICLLAEPGIVNSVWTTNFDGLVAKATKDFDLTPIEVGIDCQDRLVRQPRRGELLCVSLHGDYRYDPLINTNDELKDQETQLKDALKGELESSSLIVSGYSGRDKSIMDMFLEVFSKPGSGNIYWCGYSDVIADPVRELIETACSAGRSAFYVPTAGFDDTFARLALHCFTGEAHDRANALLSEASEDLRNLNEAFVIQTAPCKGLIKSNCFEVNCPTEVFAFGLKKWPERPWDWLRNISHGKNFVAVPHRNKVLALGLMDSINDVFGEMISGPIERTPITDDDLKKNEGAINSLMKSALLHIFKTNPGIEGDERSLIWESKPYKRQNKDGQVYLVHYAAVLSLKYLIGRMHLVIKPTIKVFGQNGAALPEDLSKIIKMEVLGYQHNKEFNQALMRWRKNLLPEKGLMTFEYPEDCGSTFRFKVRTAPLFAQIGLRNQRRPIVIDKKIQPFVKQRGIEVAEPTLLFSDQSGKRFSEDGHPLRGLLTNQPFDFSLTTGGLATSVRLGVVCPEQESSLYNEYLCQSERVHQPSKTEQDYLIDYQGFQKAFGIPLEVPRPNDNSWAFCPNPTHGISLRDGCLELAHLIIRSIDEVYAATKPHVVVVCIPERWRQWREFSTENENFDLHDFVKAYCVQKGIATQFLEQKTISGNQHCRKWWWLSVALYSKAMRTPWVLKNLDQNAAFVGLGFTIDHSAPKGQHVVLGCSHLYNSEGQGLQFRLSKIENPIFKGRNPHMSYDDSRRVAETIRQLFFETHFKLPSRVVIHKQTPFLRDEGNGLLDGLCGVDSVDLLEINIESSLRYVSSIQKEGGGFDEDNFPVRRGTVLQLGRKEALVWCHGAADSVKPGWTYFQGKRHIPAPLLVRRHAGNTDLELLATEILGLSKMDWNSGDMYSKLPATIYSSKQIAKIGSKLQRFGPVAYDYRLFI